MGNGVCVWVCMYKNACVLFVLCALVGVCNSLRVCKWIFVWVCTPVCLQVYVLYKCTYVFFIVCVSAYVCVWISVTVCVGERVCASVCVGFLGLPLSSAPSASRQRWMTQGLRLSGVFLAGGMLLIPSSACSTIPLTQRHLQGRQHCPS